MNATPILGLPIRNADPVLGRMQESGRLNGLFAEMVCDHARSLVELAPCPRPPFHAPVIFVPSKTPCEDGHRELRMFTNLHYCLAHQGELKLDQLLGPKLRGDFEAQAKRGRLHGFICDFEAAHMQYISVTAPAYLQFLARIEVRRA